MAKYTVTMVKVSAKRGEDGKLVKELLNLEFPYSEYQDASDSFFEKVASQSEHISTIEYTQINESIYLTGEDGSISHSIHLSNDAKI